jgi:hypothetical protein
MPPARSSNKNKYIAAFLLLLLISMSAYAYLMPTKAPAIETGTILVLPVQLATGNRQHRLAMESLCRDGCAYQSAKCRC